MLGGPQICILLCGLVPVSFDEVVFSFQTFGIWLGLSPLGDGATLNLLLWMFGAIRRGVRGGPLVDTAGSQQLLNSSHVRQREIRHCFAVLWLEVFGNCALSRY